MASNPSRSCCFGLLKSRTLLLPTWRGCLLLLLAVIVALWVFLKCTYPFLAVNDPIAGGVLVVEGWVAENGLIAAVEEFPRHPYALLIVTGKPIEASSPLAEYRTYADYGAIMLRKLGIPADRLHAVSSDDVKVDRTFATARAVKSWLTEHGYPIDRINVISIGPHARRSRLLYQKAFGEKTRVGIMAVDDREYDARRWWTTSAGVRLTLSELIGYAYARCIFRAPAE